MSWFCLCLSDITSGFRAINKLNKPRRSTRPRNDRKRIEILMRNSPAFSNNKKVKNVKNHALKYPIQVNFWATLRAQLYGLGHPRQPSPRTTLAEVTFSLFLSKLQPTIYIIIANLSQGAKQLGWASCLTSAGRVTLASRTTFLHINALVRLTGTTLGVANVA